MSKPHRTMLSDIIAQVGEKVAVENESVTTQPTVTPTPAPALTPVVAAPVAAPAIAEAPREAVVRTVRPAQKRATAGRLRDRSKQVTLYLEEPVYDQLREIAHVEKAKMHQLIVEAIDLLLKKKGSPSISALMKKAG